ncbi:MAG TPA: OsmC family protein [Syntrophales bacterium]|nr:OsmC family protein [Syntrophales bacterium]
MKTFKAESKLGKGLSVENTSRGFRVLMDEPPTLRGTDTGMNPVEMLLCTLGACQCIVARLFAKARKIDLHEFRVELEGDLDPDGFLRGKEGVRPGFKEIRYTVHISADASREEIENFVSFVKARCPVSDTLAGGVSVIANGIVING